MTPFLTVASVLLAISCIGLAYLTSWALDQAKQATLDAREGWEAAAYWQQECGAQVEVICNLTRDKPKVVEVFIP